jgi:hypothetical protein
LAAYEWNDENMDWSKGLYQKTIDLKLKNPSLKVLLAVGGNICVKKGRIMTKVIKRKKYFL